MVGFDRDRWLWLVGGPLHCSGTIGTDEVVVLLSGTSIWCDGEGTKRDTAGVVEVDDQSIKCELEHQPLIRP